MYSMYNYCKMYRIINEKYKMRNKQTVMNGDADF